nr:immunoglobulin heavy chain junction region [Mus musculus]NSM04729.1 immunoglobulin heavy chain junction region [Mus musculus]NSM04902.1 immunoglobulin heavy chain junction region [Mus musculus]NSM06486.1 immunoglobulin heavy chain junction region [Mus musculus]NSM06534.1 immunoglobulin heavy chain junction region [Mus musculus]
CTTIYYAMDYW